MKKSISAFRLLSNTFETDIVLRELIPYVHNSTSTLSVFKVRLTCCISYLLTHLLTYKYFVVEVVAK